MFCYYKRLYIHYIYAYISANPIQILSKMLRELTIQLFIDAIFMNVLLL